MNIAKSGRTPEQQKNNMFKTMNDADKKKNSQFVLTFEQIQDRAIEMGGSEGRMYKQMREQADKMSKELCLLCDKPRDSDTRGFITIPDRDGKIYKVHYECVLKLIKEKLFG